MNKAAACAVVEISEDGNVARKVAMLVANEDRAAHVRGLNDDAIPGTDYWIAWDMPDDDWEIPDHWQLIFAHGKDSDIGAIPAREAGGVTDCTICQPQYKR